jgi:hypothetical protein
MNDTQHNDSEQKNKKTWVSAHTTHCINNTQHDESQLNNTQHDNTQYNKGQHNNTQHLVSFC